MSNIVQITDFKEGEFRIPKTSHQEETLQKYLDRWERHYLIRLFGRELYDAFIANLVSGVPTSQRFVDVFNEFTDQDCDTYILDEIDDDCDCFCDSEGMKIMIQGFIYFHYVRHTFTVNTTNGVKQTKSENSESVQTVSADLISRYNGAVQTYRCIQRRMCKNSDVYPEFKGIVVEEIISV